MILISPLLKSDNDKKLIKVIEIFFFIFYWLEKFSFYWIISIAILQD